jgi:hypothetical protein
MQGRAMQGRHLINISLLIHQEQLHESRLQAIDGNMERTHLRVVSQLIRIHSCFEQEELHDVGRGVLYSEVEEAFTVRVKTLFVGEGAEEFLLSLQEREHAFGGALKVAFLHFVDFAEFDGLVGLDEL